MPLQSRVSPFGELFATSARGTLMGNRGGRLHDDQRRLTARRWMSRQWICCKLDFNNRHRTVWGDSYTELFFLDEVTAFAAGHRPCFECRRKDAEHFAVLFSGAATESVHPRESGDPALDSRLRGNEWSVGGRASAADMDRVLHAERLDGKQKRLHRMPVDALPDGAMIAQGADAFALRHGHILPWTPTGYSALLPRPRGIVDVLTPPAILTVLERGYRPQWHPSAG